MKYDPIFDKKPVPTDAEAEMTADQSDRVVYLFSSEGNDERRHIAYQIEVALFVAGMIAEPTPPMDVKRVILDAWDRALFN